MNLWILLITIFTSHPGFIEETDTFRVFNSSHSALKYLEITEPAYTDYKLSRYWQLFDAYYIKESSGGIVKALKLANEKTVMLEKNKRRNK